MPSSHNVNNTIIVLQLSVENEDLQYQLDESQQNQECLRSQAGVFYYVLGGEPLLTGTVQFHPLPESSCV